MAIELNSDTSALTVSTCVHTASSLSSPFLSSCSLARQPAFYPHRLVPSPQAPHGRPKLLCSAPAEASASRSPCSSKLTLSCPLSVSTISAVHLALLQMSATLIPTARYVVLQLLLVTGLNIGLRRHARSKAIQPTSSMKLLTEPKLSLFLLVSLERYDLHTEILRWSYDSLHSPV